VVLAAAAQVDQGQGWLIKSAIFYIFNDYFPHCSISISYLAFSYLGQGRRVVLEVAAEAVQDLGQGQKVVLVVAAEVDHDQEVAREAHQGRNRDQGK
jgi:hypothetical protein